MMDYVPDYWDTTRLHVRAVQPNDTDALLALFNANSHVEPWDPTFKQIERPEMADLVDKSLTWAARGIKPFQMQCFERLDTGQLVGYYHCTYGTAHADVLYISMFVMAHDAQHAGYGREVVDGLSIWWATLRDIRRAWAEVYLKNWTALRFWIERGFTTIIEWEGDNVLSEKGHAAIILEKRWRGVPGGVKRQP